MPETGAVFREKTCGIVELPSPAERIYIAFFNAFFFTAQHNAMHPCRADTFVLVFFSGADRFNQRGFRLLISIDIILCAKDTLLYHGENNCYYYNV